VGSDSRLERFWRRSQQEAGFDRLGQLEFTAATSFTFSVWDQQPRFDQIYNQDRNLVTYDLLRARGIPTIPYLLCSATEDYTAAGNWLKAHPEVDMVAATAQHYRGPESFSEFLARLDRLRTEAQRRLRFLVVGCAKTERIRRLFLELGDATVVTGHPVHCALTNTSHATEIDRPKIRSLKPRSARLRLQLRAYDNLCEAARLEAELREADGAPSSRITVEVNAS